MTRVLVLGLSLAVTFSAMILATDSNTGSTLAKMLANVHNRSTDPTGGGERPEMTEGETGELFKEKRRQGKILKNILIAKIPHPHVGTVLPKAFVTAGIALRNSGGGWGGGGGGWGGGGGGWGGRGWGGWGVGGGGGGGGGWGGWGGGGGPGWGGWNNGWGGWGGGGGGGGGGWCESKKVRKAKAKAKKKIAKAKAKQQKKAAKAGVGQGWGPPQGWGWGGQGGGGGGGGGGGWGGWGKTGGGGGGIGGGGWRSLDENNNNDGPPPPFHGMKLESGGNSPDMDSEFKDEVWPNSPPRTARIGLEMDGSDTEGVDDVPVTDNEFQVEQRNLGMPYRFFDSSVIPSAQYGGDSNGGFRVLTTDDSILLRSNGQNDQVNLGDLVRSVQSTTAGDGSTVSMSQSMFLRLVCPTFPSLCMYARS